MILSITVNPKDLIANLIFNEYDEEIILEMKFICSNISTMYSYHNLIFTLYWYELRRGLADIAKFRKKYDIKISYDELTERLLRDAANESKNIRNQKSAIDISEVELDQILSSSGFNRVMKNEQIRDTLKLLSIKHGANFSVPGAGKTTTLLAVNIVLKKYEIVTKLFVVSPINAFVSWEEEIEDIFKDKIPKVIRLQSKDIDNFQDVESDNPDIILVNYEKLRKNINQLIPFFFRNKIHLILDESHRIKSGMNNLSYTQIIKLADLACRKDILSGTPMPQHYRDLEPQFDFLWPNIGLISNQMISEEKETVISNINHTIKGLYVRTTKRELNLDDPIIRIKNIPMGPIQSELYQLFRFETARRIAGMDRTSLNNFRKIGRSVIKLLQASTNPMLLTSRFDYDEEILPKPVEKEFWELLEDYQKFEKPAKLEYIKERVRNITEANEENKVLIWSYFVRNILLLEKILTQYNPVTIYGGIPTGSDEDELYREGRIRKFHEDSSCRVMIANPQACGEGISLHKVCHFAIYLDRNFNAAYFLQSIDRIHRLGLERGTKTNIEILTSPNSIDEVLIPRLNEKIKTMGAVLDDPYLHSLAYDPEDIPSDDINGIDQTDYEAIMNHVNKNE